MGCLSSKPVTVTPQTHRFHARTQAGTLLSVAVAKRGRRQSNINDSANLDRTMSFGCKVRLADIDIEEEIGAGTFGAVYKVHYKGKRIAMKKLMNQTHSARTLRNFRNELEILSLLTHPNIVQFLGAVVEPPHLCLLTELCGGSVVDLLKMAETKKLNITWGLTIAIALDCARACNYLHARDPIVLHRDLKGENLLLTEKFQCKLSDFGLSRSLKRNHNANTMCGTPRWLAPEIFRGEDYSEKIDVYSYSIVLWELFCFKKPYMEHDAITLAYMVAHNALRPPLCSHIPDVLQRLMKSCWNEDPSQRPAFSTVIFLLEEAKELIQTELVIDLSKSYVDAVAPTVKLRPATSPAAPNVRPTRYGLVSGKL